MMSQQQREHVQRERDREASFQHTQLGTYLAGAFGLMYLWASSAQGIVDKYHFSARWFYLYGALCLFAYLYMRPFVRRGLGSAGRGYLNFGTLYICWLCSAVFCHLPSLESLGIDIKADVSLGLSIAASSFLVLGVMHGVQQLLFHFKLLTPAPGATQQAVWTCLLLNTLTLAMTCSTYFQLCGNGGAREGLQDSSFLHQAVCTNWLAPIATREYPNFSAWMLYGERSDDAAAAAAAAAAAVQQARVAAPRPQGSSSGSSVSILDPGFWWGPPPAPPPPPEEPFGLGAFNASQLAELVSPVSSADSGGSVISPVFTMWITLVALYIVNVLADHVAASNMSARHISELRRDLVPDPDIALLAQLSTAAGITLRENAHQWAAAQQQRHKEARKSLGAYPRAPGVERSARANKKHVGMKRSKSLESHRPARQPWSPRYTMERALVNILETTSSFSFKAAALLEGKPFTWQDSMLHPGTSGGGTGAGGGGAGQDSRSRSRTQQQQQSRHQRQGARGRRSSRSRQQQQQQRQDVSDSVGSLSPVSAALGSSSTARTQAGPQTGGFHRNAAAGGSLRAKPSAVPSIENEPSFKLGLPAVAAAAAGGGSSGGSSSQSSGSTSRLKGIRHQRSRSLSSIQSGDGGPMLDAEGDLSTDLQSPQQQQSQDQQRQRQQQLEDMSVPSVPPVTSPFARVAHHGPGSFTRAGFGSAISLSFGSPPSSHRWTHQQQQQRMLQQQQQQQQQHPPADASTAGGSPASAATPASSAAGPAAANPAAAVLQAADAAVQPPFLDMVPWYSGTSADLFKTMFDLLISVKLFLGRFDMRTMQAATAASMAEHPAHSTPREGDGFTFENYADRQELWLDFIADTGDGGNPTYAVARALAAPELVVPVSSSMASAITGIDSCAQQCAARHAEQHVALSKQQAGKGPHHSSGRGGSRAEALQTSNRVSNSSSNRISSSSSAAEEEAEHSASYQDGLLELPRGEVLLIGGDLAYPNPSRETFEQRLFVPFQEAMPPPPHYHPGRLVVHKPDLPPSFGPPAPPTRLGGVGLPAGHSPRASRGASVAALRDYGGPNAFAIPGNHDWIDGLETFIQQIQHKGWLGGWLLPQEKSYFALRLPAGWWVFGLDLALVGDIDMCQYRYFANLIEQRLGPSDNVIIITHEPTWLLEWFWASSSSSNLRQLVRGHLRGRARVHMAGDLHFYMRHSYCSGSRTEPPRPDSAAAAAAAAAGEATGHQQQQQQQQHSDRQAPVSGSTQGDTSAGAQDTMQGSAVQGGTNGGLQEAALQEAASQSETQARRLSSSSDGGSSSSSGVDSCMSGPESGPVAAPAAAAAAAAAARSHADSTQGSGRGAAQGGGGSSSSSSSTAIGSPVEKACKNLPRLLLSRSSFEGLADVSPTKKPCNGSTAAGVTGQLPHGATAQAAAGAVPHQQYSQVKYKQQYGQQNGVQYSPQQQQYAQQYSHHQQQYTGSPSRFCDTSGSPGGLAAGMHQQQQQHSFLDPEHLIVNGMGGAFMHPTHVFSYSRFAVLDDEAATATAAIYSSADPRRNLQSSSSVWHNEALSWHCPVSPSGSDLWDFQSPLATAAPAAAPPAAAAATAAAGAATANGHAPAAGSSGVQEQQQQQAGVPEGGSGGTGAPGVYKCAALFPSAATSLKLGSNNLHLFRFKNSRFDVIGGAIYFLSIVSILPRCNAGLALLSSASLLDFTAVFTQEFMACWYALFMESYLSLFMACTFLLLCFGFAKGGGVGAVSGERQEQRQVQAQRARSQQQQRHVGQPPAAGTGAAPPAAAGAAVKGSSSGDRKQKQRSPVVGPLVKLRTGGISNQLLVAMLHTGAHLTLAIVLLLLLELGVEICIKYESLGQDGMGSMYRWFESYQDEHFPDPMGLRAMAHKWSLGLYPGVIKAAMTLYDIPEAIAVVRNAVCAAPTTAAGFASLTRLQVWAYYGGMLAYYWLLATPAMGFVFGLYLYISVCWFHVHYDEAFSALRIANFKGLTRLHITREGDLEMYTLGMDRVPTSWREDPRWYGPAGAGSRLMPAHVTAYPSRWIPAEGTDLSGSLSGELEAAGVCCEHKQRGGSVDGEAAAAAAASPSTGLRLVDYVKVPRIRSL